MMHIKRVWQVAEVESAEELARMLTEQTCVLCSGFNVREHPGYLFLNDATSADGAQEYAVIKGGVRAERHVQIESITFSWCTYGRVLQHIRHALSGQDDLNDFAHDVSLRLESPEEQGTCPLCA